ncbi:hypothetical protein AcetOrient_orf03263 [Acetobacter orientalis]|uniref:Uncharacterized protein n=1 Tax=Acetobacter orientalis TaxID=146474 RepID=A0A2Z5ZJ31_9PROT|nr:hypothetical protein AcetOrient_orf03263 [Acetobacter orientalis]
MSQKAQFFCAFIKLWCGGKIVYSRHTNAAFNFKFLNRL